MIELSNRIASHLEDRNESDRERVEMRVRMEVQEIESQISVLIIVNGDCVYFPPNSCMPSKAKMRMNKKSKKSKEMIDRIEFINEITRLRKLTQYLKTREYEVGEKVARLGDFKDAQETKCAEDGDAK